MSTKRDPHWAAKICTLLLAIALWLVIRQRAAPLLRSGWYDPITPAPSIQSQE